MNSAYTNLEQSLACKEMGAKQNKFPQAVWWESRTHDGSPLWLFYYGLQRYIPNPLSWVTALPFYTDDPNDQSVVGLLGSFGFHITFRDPIKWRAWWNTRGGRGISQFQQGFDSLGALLMACYEKWKLNNV